MRTDLTDEEQWYLNYINLHSHQGTRWIGWPTHFESVDSLVECGMIERASNGNIRTTPNGALLTRFYEWPDDDAEFVVRFLGELASK